MRDLGAEIDELRAGQEALSAEWQRAKTAVRDSTVEINALTDIIRNSASGIDQIMDEIRALVRG